MRQRIVFGSPCSVPPRSACASGHCKMKSHLVTKFRVQPQFTANGEAKLCKGFCELWFTRTKLDSLSTRKTEESILIQRKTHPDARTYPGKKYKLRRRPSSERRSGETITTARSPRLLQT